MILKIQRGRVKFNSKKIVYFNMDELNLIMKRIFQLDYSLVFKNIFLIDKVLMNLSDNDLVLIKKDDGDFDMLFCFENGDC